MDTGKDRHGLYLRRQKHRRGPSGGRIAAAGGAAALAALIAWPATGAVGQDAAAASTTAACPWVTSAAPVSQRVAQLMAAMSLDDKITMVEGHGTTNPYVFYTPDGSWVTPVSPSAAPAGPSSRPTAGMHSAGMAGV
jgi:hypothetical protein